MKLTEIEQFWPILEAIRAGKTIQINTIDGYWEDVVDYAIFSRPLDKYRIKPEKKKARKEEIQFIFNASSTLWGIPKGFWSGREKSAHVGSPLTLYIDVETNQFIDPKNLGEYDVQE